MRRCPLRGTINFDGAQGEKGTFGCGRSCALRLGPGASTIKGGIRGMYYSIKTVSAKAARMASTKHAKQDSKHTTCYYYHYLFLNFTLLDRFLFIISFIVIYTCEFHFVLFYTLSDFNAKLRCRVTSTEYTFDAYDSKIS